MAYKLQANFAGGELDPVLRKRISLNKYSTGLATARNVVVGRTGRIVSRPGKRYVKEGGNLVGSSITIGADKKVIVHPMPWINRYLEFGEGYVQVYESDGTVVGQTAHSLVEADFEHLQFINIKINNSYNTGYGSSVPPDSSTYGTLVMDVRSSATYPMRIVYDNGSFSTTQTTFFWLPAQPTAPVGSTLNGTGYNVDYLFTTNINGEEGISREWKFSTSGALLPAPATSNLLAGIKVDEYDCPTGLTLSNCSPEVRVYRRPSNGGAYGFIGSTKVSTVSGSDLVFAFEDLGQDADYTNQPPEPTSGVKEAGISPFPVSFFAAKGVHRTAAMYQGRLLVGSEDKVIASRPGFPGNFYRDLPLDSDSAISTRSSGDGNSEILRMIDDNGLVVFTTGGIYLHGGLLSASNLSLPKKSPAVIDYRVPPLSLPGGIIFVDAKTNTVRQLRYFDEKQGYIADELSIFSDHLFRENRITSWAFDEGSLPLLWVTFADGTYATFTYEESQQMRAWTRHDSGTDLEFVTQLQAGFNSSGVHVASKLIFVTKETDGTQRWIEHGIDRFINAEEFETNTEVDKGEKIAAMDGIVTFSTLLNDDLIDDTLTIAPVTPGVWDGPLDLYCVDDAIFPNTPGDGAVGTIYHHFDPTDRTQVTLTIITRTDANNVVVQPSATYPSDYGTDPRIYKTQSSTLTGLSHLEGVNVGIIIDGDVVGSPNNDDQSYISPAVSGGTLTLPAGRSGAIIHVGRPYVMDIETLDINTVEQRPTHNEVLTCNKVKIETYLSRGLYIGGRFPSTDVVKGDQDDIAVGKTMESFDHNIVDYEDDNPIIGNRYDQPVSRTTELTIPGDWKSNGRICIRQVDPLHFEILAITPDVDDQRR